MRFGNFLRCPRMLLFERNDMGTVVENTVAAVGSNAAALDRRVGWRSKVADYWTLTKPEVNYINGHQVQNKILLALPKREYAALFAKLKFVSLPIHTVLNQIGKPI